MKLLPSWYLYFDLQSRHLDVSVYQWIREGQLWQAADLIFNFLAHAQSDIFGCNSIVVVVCLSGL